MGWAGAFGFVGFMATIAAMVWAVCWAAVRINERGKEDDPPR